MTHTTEMQVLIDAADAMPDLLADNGEWQEWDLDGEIVWHNKATGEIERV